MDIVHQCTHPVWEPDRVQAQDAVLSTPQPVTVIDIDVTVPGFLQPGLVHGVSLLADKFLVDVECKRVP